MFCFYRFLCCFYKFRKCCRKICIIIIMLVKTRTFCMKNMLKTLKYTTCDNIHSRDTINMCFYGSFNRPKLNTNFNNLGYNSINKRETNSNIVLNEVFQSIDNKHEQDWASIRNKILENKLNRDIFTMKNIDAAIMVFCSRNKKYDLASAYWKYLETQHTKPNLATLGKYLRILYTKNEENRIWKFDNNKEQDIIKIYDNLRKEYPVLDSMTLENVLLALSLTNRWKISLELLQEIKISASPSAAAYSATAAACFLNEEEHKGWSLLKELLELDKLPTNIAFLSYLETVKCLSEKDAVITKLEKLFLFLKEHELKCEEQVIRNLCEFTKKMGFKSEITEVPFKGFCRNCTKQLQKFELAENEFEELKSKFFDNVILGRDLFTKTNPQELESFKNFVAKMGRFDVVLDGLNVAYSAGNKQPPHVLALMVAMVVEYFVNQNKSVLVLGRVHMNRWPKNEWNYVKQNATVFLTQNISQDDPYLLYCALQSGKDTIVVTRDLMRGHKFLLKEPKYKTLFNRWLSQRQYRLVRVDNKRRPIFEMPPPFSVMAQKKNQVWHIPYQKDGQTVENGESHKHWLCIEMN